MMTRAFYTSPSIVTSKGHFILVAHSEVCNLAEKDPVLDSAFSVRFQVQYVIQ
jgi:hypothetical protein